jgi:hypothetical protein
MHRDGMARPRAFLRARAGDNSREQRGGDAEKQPARVERRQGHAPSIRGDGVFFSTAATMASARKAAPRRLSQRAAGALY